MPWFKEWFNSPYYHKLYGKRDEKEAGELIGNLLGYLKPGPDWVFLDLACGKGRHASQIASKGFLSYGVDLSPESIQAAKSHPVNGLFFEVHDMRQTYKPAFFNVVLNLFTSFGYFDSSDDNVKVLQAVHNDLKPAGLFVQDYFNATKVLSILKPQETKIVDGIEFNIEKHIENKKVIKNIRFTDQGVEYRFCEVVSLFELEDFRNLYEQCGFELLAIFGDYDLNPYDQNNSDRLILVSKSI